MNIGQLYQRSQTGSFYCKVDGKQVRMGPDEKTARKKRDSLVAKSAKVETRNGQRHTTVRDAMTLYLDYYQKHRAPTTYNQRVVPFKKLCEMFGDKEAHKFTPANLLRWVETDYGTTGNTRQCDLIKWVITAFNWIERNHGIPSLIRKTDKPTPDQREFYVPFEQWDDLLNCCSSHVRNLVSFMLYTGARPQEAVALTPRHWVKDRFVLRASESKGGKYVRTIFVPDNIRKQVVSLVKENKHYVFTNSRGGRWTKSATNSAARRIKIAMNMPEFCMYVCRHSFAVERIVEGGLDLAIVAKLMGHRSTEMVYRRYGHLSKQIDLLSKAVNAGR